VGEHLAGQVEAIYKAKLEQSPLFQRAEPLDPSEAADIALTAIGALLDALVYLASQVPDLDA
jgi:hypothetical protein